MPRISRRDNGRERQLRHILESQRHRVLETLRVAMREGRSEGVTGEGEVQDEAERSETDIQTDLEFALLQMRSETLARIDEALERLDAGDFGRCAECGAEISGVRLKALPFAIRCCHCEEKYETGTPGQHPISMTWRAQSSYSA